MRRFEDGGDHRRNNNEMEDVARPHPLIRSLLSVPEHLKFRNTNAHPRKQMSSNPYETQPAHGVSTTSELYERMVSNPSSSERTVVELGRELPEFMAESTEDKRFSSTRLEGRWSVVFLCPKSSDPVASTDIAALARASKELAERAEVVIISCNSVSGLLTWKKDIEEIHDVTIPFPFLADVDATIADQFGLCTGVPKIRSLVPASLLVIADPFFTVQHLSQYPSTTGRNIDELLRTLDALQVVGENVATGVNWMVGDDIFVVDPKRSKSELQPQFPKGLFEITPWFRLTPPPEAADDDPGVPPQQDDDETPATISVGPT